jgi:hypothetical protein
MPASQNQDIPQPSGQDDWNLIADAEVNLYLKLLGDLPFGYTLKQAFSIDPAQLLAAARPAAPPQASSNSSSPGPDSSNPPSTNETAEIKCKTRCVFTTFDDDCCARNDYGVSFSVSDPIIADTAHMLDLSAILLLNFSGPVQFDHPQASPQGYVSNMACGPALALRAAFEPLGANMPARNGWNSSSCSGGSEQSQRAQSEGQGPRGGGIEVHVDPISMAYNEALLCTHSGAASTYGTKVRLVVLRKYALPLLQALRMGNFRFMSLARIFTDMYWHVNLHQPCFVPDFVETGVRHMRTHTHVHAFTHIKEHFIHPYLT